MELTHVLTSIELRDGSGLVAKNGRNFWVETAGCNPRFLVVVLDVVIEDDSILTFFPRFCISDKYCQFLPLEWDVSKLITKGESIEAVFKLRTDDNEALSIELVDAIVTTIPVDMESSIRE